MISILQIETATKNCSVALSQNGETVVCLERSDEGLSHAENLHVFIEHVMKKCQLQFKDLNAVAIGAGPGSYTGLRIGVSAAKGFCYTANIPLIAINSLDILAQEVSIENGYIIPMIDARRMEVYCSILDENHHTISETKAKVLDENSFSELDKPCYFVGDSNDKAKEILKSKNFIFNDKISFPSASCMSALAYSKFKNKEFVDLAYYEPNYLKEFQKK